jgi:hypothetical protein
LYFRESSLLHGTRKKLCAAKKRETVNPSRAMLSAGRLACIIATTREKQKSAGVFYNNAFAAAITSS